VLNIEREMYEYYTKKNSLKLYYNPEYLNCPKKFMFFDSLSFNLNKNNNIDNNILGLETEKRKNTDKKNISKNNKNEQLSKVIEIEKLNTMAEEKIKRENEMEEKQKLINSKNNGNSDL